MKFANETFFFVSALLLGGLFVSFLPHLSAARPAEKPNYFWLISLGLITVSFGTFAIAPHTNIALLPVANTLFFAGYVYLGLFSRSLNQAIGRWLIILAPVIIILFGLVLEYLRGLGNYYYRVSFVVGLTALCLLWILYELLVTRRRVRSIQLNFLICTTVVELALAITRVLLVAADYMPNSVHIYEEPYISTLVRWMWIACTALSYVAIIGYWTERLSFENAKNVEDNIRVITLLEERDTLIASLLKANKTAATGALSASIAHELNQPLGASNLNIQFLKMKLGKGGLSSEVGHEVLDALEADNQRAVTIVKSLRSIFSDASSAFQRIQLNNSISKVLDIVRPELKSQNIELTFQGDEGVWVEVNPGEIEQVILNLLNNAIQSLSQNGVSGRSISIEVRHDGTSVCMSISDNGHGVSPEFKPALFELLDTTKQSGMGLGLWLCRHIVTRYKGSIWHEDRDAGGARFIVKLPLAQ
ncbi:MAG: hypothetical protein RL517_1444 [Pseudomonadota bacterium]